MRHWHREQDGTSLIEMMIAILVLGIAMSALAQTLIQSLGATREAQDVQVVTAGIQGVIEDLQSLEWTTAAIYSGDKAAADARWTNRLDASGDFEGLDIVERAGPVSAADRDTRLPLPHTTEDIDGNVYTFDLYPVWVDRSAIPDGAVDTKRFVVIASWTDPVRGDQELRFEAERAPSQAEAGSTSSGGRFVFTLASPDPIDANPADGTIAQSITIQARSNVGMAAFITATLTWNEPVVDANGTVTGYVAAIQDVTMSGTEFVSGTGYVAFSGTFNGRRGNVGTNGKYRFPNGPVDVAISGAPASGGSAVTGQTSFTVRSSPYAPGSPGGPVTPGPTPTPAPNPYGYTVDPQVDFTSISNFCRQNGNHRLGGAVTVTLLVRDVVVPAGTTGADAVVNVTYPYWTSTGAPGAPDGTNSVAATFTSGTRSSSVWTATIPVDNSQHYQSGATLTVTASLQRPSDGGNDSATTTVTVSSC